MRIVNRLDLTAEDVLAMEPEAILVVATSKGWIAFHYQHEVTEWKNEKRKDVKCKAK